jgi:hypothetical protein
VNCTHLPGSPFPISYPHLPPSSQKEVAQALGGWEAWRGVSGQKGPSPARLQNKSHLECSEVKEGDGEEAPKSPLTPGPRGCAQGWLLGTYQGQVYSVHSPGCSCVLGTQNPAWPNRPTDSAPRGHWGFTGGRSIST